LDAAIEYLRELIKADPRPVPQRLLIRIRVKKWKELIEKDLRKQFFVFLNAKVKKVSKVFREVVF